MSRLLIALQFYPGDQAEAMQLARLMADLEPQHRRDADLLFCGRFDCVHDWDTINYCCSKFNIATFLTRRKATGWPAGCNEMWHDLVDLMVENRIFNLGPAYDAILTCEADCVPMVSDWINRLKEAWLNRTPGALIAGHLAKSNNHAHINGNLLLSGHLADLQQVQKLRGSPPHIGWDYHHAFWFSRAGWAVIPEIVSWHSTQHFTEEDWDKLVANGCAFFHGVKHGRGIPLAYKRLLPRRSPVKVTLLDKPTSGEDIPSENNRD